MQPGTVELPAPDLAAAFGDEYAHIKRKGRNEAFCGAAPGPTPHREHGWQRPLEVCGCGASVCPACRDMWRTYLRTRAWEGA